MFLQIGNTFINQERIEYIKIYVESDTKKKLLNGKDGVNYCVKNTTFVSTIDVPYYKVMIVIKSEETRKWVIPAYSGEDFSKASENAECLRHKLFENLSIHNIKIDLDTGEIVC